MQRWLSDQQRDIFCKFLKPLMDQHQGWLVYEIDDNMSGKDIPMFNRGRQAFESPTVQENIRKMLNEADFVTVTTDYLKQFYHRNYGVPLENIIAIPNLLPRYLFGDRYDPARKAKQFGKNKARPRVGIVSSLSHFNVEGVRVDADGNACRRQKKPDGKEIWINEKGAEVDYAATSEVVDDIDAILDCITSTVDDFQWVFFGYCPPKLAELAKAKKIEVHGGSPIYNYASAFHNLGLQAVVAAVNPIEFNFCKSFIKTMECAALGVPCFATNCLPYSRVMPREMTFGTSAELKEKLLRMKVLSPDRYRDIIEAQWKWLNSPHDEGDFHINSFWAEDNLRIYADLYRLRRKGYTVSLAQFVKQYDEHRRLEAENTIFKNENILITR